MFAMLHTDRGFQEQLIMTNNMKQRPKKHLYHYHKPV